MLHILDLERGATTNEIKAAYRTLVKVWHPDRFSGDEALRKAAGTKLAIINGAYQYLLKLPTTPEPSIRETVVPRPNPNPPTKPREKTQPSYVRPGVRPTTSKAPEDQADWLTMKRVVWLIVLSVILICTLIGGLIKYAANEAQRQAKLLPPPYLSGEEFGTVTNNSTGTTAPASMQIVQIGKQLSGCFIVSPPLFGSGVLTGDVEGQQVLLQTKSQDFSITFTSEIDKSHLIGTYVVEPTTGPQQFGTFKLNKHIGTMDLGKLVQDCPKDSDVAVSNGTATRP